MSIKYINCFGTSFTQGGGFEYWSHHRGIKIAYDGLGPMVDKTHWEFSWPGQLQKYLGDTYQVRNFAKCGFGNERIYRKTHDMINNPDFDPKEHIFLFEFSDIGRKEVYHADLDKHLILNYNFDSKDGERILADDPTCLGKFHQLSLAYDYWFETKEQELILNKDANKFGEFFRKTISFNNVVSNVSRNVEMFLSYLEFNNVQYVIVQKPFCLNLYNFKEQLEHRCIKKGIVEICNRGEMTINAECSPKKEDDLPEYFGIGDGHGGYYWAIHVSNLIFKEINKRYFKSKLNPQWVGLTEKEIKNKIAENFRKYEESRSEDITDERNLSTESYVGKSLF